MRRFVVLAFLLFASSTALACSCARPDGPVEDQVSKLYESSEIVGVFEVTGWSFGSRSFEGSSQFGRWLHLEPRRIFKGPHAKLFAPVAPLLFGTSCDVSYSKGAALLVYASPMSPVRLSWCSPSGSLIRRLEHLPVIFARSEAWKES
jgi:hypothetical protein